LPLDEVLRLAHELCDALSHAHGKGIIHRDLKPSNILVGRDGHARLSDFGIARALDLTGDDRLTISEALVGTLAYMSPEQHARERRVDGRSDVFSLGMVLFECLTGRLPFEAATATEEAKNRLIGQFSSLRELRPEVPVEVEGAIARALAPDPQARWGDARAFAEGLGVPLGTASSRGGLARRTRSRTVARGLGFLSLTTLGAFLVYGMLPGREEPDAGAMRYSVLWLADRDDTLSATACDSVRARLERWQGLKVVHGEGTSIAARRGDGSRSTSGPAPRTILCERVASAGRGIIRLTSRESLAGSDVSRSWEVALTDSLGESAYDTLAASALRGGLASLSAGEDPAASISYPAVLKHQEGLRLAEDGRFASATRAFAAASALDSAYDYAALWQAYAAILSDSSVPHEVVSRLEEIGSGDQRPSTRLQARALLLFHRQRFPEAAAAFSALSESAAPLPSLLGVAESLRRDSVIVPSRESPSGYRFRSDHRKARAAFLRAASRASAGLRAWCFARAARLTLREPQQIRVGSNPAAAGELWFGLPALYRDTVLIFPFSVTSHAARAPESVPSTYAAALARERQAFAEIARSWAAQFPTDVEARLSFASALELDGQISAPEGQPDATKELLAALTLSTARQDRQAVRRALVRLRLKRFETGAARSLIDTLLAADPDSAEIRAGLWKAALAALVGDQDLVARELTAAWSNSVVAREELGSDLDAPVRQQLARFTAVVALGLCDSIVIAERRFNNALHALVAPVEQDAVRRRVLGRLQSDVTPCDYGERVRAIREAPTVYSAAQRSYALGDTLEVRRQLRATASLRRGSRGVDQSWDAVFQEAWLHLAIGDSLKAFEAVEQALVALPSAPRFLTEQLFQAAGFVRAVRLLLSLQHSPGQHRADLESILDSLQGPRI
jgi:tetratricopeptide (TPR) repeat protein